MALRMTGLVSGLDTESIVRELMKAQRLKTNKVENKITKLEWKQDKWKSLNTKLYAFYTGPLSKLRLQGDFNTKKVTSSNESKIEVTANPLAPEGTHSVQVETLASGQYITGSKLNNTLTVNTSTKLTALGFNAGEGTTISIEAGGKPPVNLDIGSSTTVGNFIDACKAAGLNASYDTTQKRFFISSKESGIKNAFSITTSSSELAQDRNEIRDFIEYGSMSTMQKKAVDDSLNILASDGDNIEARETILSTAHKIVSAKFINSYITDEDNINAVTVEERTRLEAELAGGETLDEAKLKAAVKTKLTQKASLALEEEYQAWKTGTATESNVFKVSEDGLNNRITNYITDNGSTITQTNSLNLLGLSEIIKTTDIDGVVSVSADAHVALVQASDAKVTYNGAELTSSSNTISVNGLTFNLKGATEGEAVSLSVTKDTQAVYDMIKNFVKAYNELLTEMNEAYGANSAKGFEPLSKEEKESMTDKQIEQWENKIKESLLRRDDKLSSIMTNMRSTLGRSVKLDEKSYSLSSFGITTDDYREKGILHIFGDTDNPVFSARADKLMKALTEDPETVMSVFNELAGEIYKTMSDQMSSTKLSSALTFYNDKEMKTTVTRHQSELKKLEIKLKAMEDRYFKQFSAMETAMARMNSQSSAIASMLNMNGQK